MFTVLDKFDANGVLIFSFKKHAFVDGVFTLILSYKKQYIRIQKFSQLMKYLLPANAIDIIAGDFNVIF